MNWLLWALVMMVLAGTTALAADLVPLPYRTPPPAFVPVFTWTGFHVGGNIGGAATSINELWSPTFGVSPILGSTGGASFAAGFQAGYDWQFAPSWVAGIEVRVSIIFPSFSSPNQSRSGLRGRVEGCQL